MNLERLKTKIRGTLDLKKLCIDGLKVGVDFNVQHGVIIDPGHCWLIEIGNRVTLAPGVHILAHDASTKKFIGYTRIAQVRIGDDVFIGAGTIILPGVTIGNSVVVGAGSVVTKDLKSNGIYVGNPAKFISSLDSWIGDRSVELSTLPVFEKEYVYGKITEEQKEIMKEKLKHFGAGYIV